MTLTDTDTTREAASGTPASRDQRWASAALALAVTMVLLAAIGIVRNYSPVPFWDMWDGYVGFFLRAREQGWPAWFEMHNEHCLVLSRLLFYADIAWLGGKGVLPLAASALSVAAVALVFCHAVSRTGVSLNPVTRRALWAICLGVAFFWSQSENFTWAFQIQFMLAELLPLMAFWLAAQAATGDRPRLYAAGATACAVLALGVMGNGILVLPMLLVLGVSLGLGRPWTLTTLAVGVAAVAAFRATHPASAVHASLLNVWLDRPLDVVRFVLRYLGGGLWFALRGRHWATGIAQAVGLLVPVISLVLLPGAWRARRSAPLRLAMLAVVAYVCATALGTALGRLPLPPGLHGALVSRYTGLANMAWLALMIAALPAARALRSPVRLPRIAVGLLLVLMTFQLNAARGQATMVYERDLAALALAMQVDDPAAIAAVYPATSAGIALDTASRAAAAHLPVFGNRAMAETPGLLGRRVVASACQAGIEHTATIVGTPQAMRIDGHLKLPFRKLAPHPAPVLDDRDTIVGWVLARPDGARAQDDAAAGVPFSGYVRTQRAVAVPPGRLRICQPPTDASSAHPE